VFVLNGDVLTDVDLTAMRRFHEARGSRTTIYLTPVDDPRAYGLVETEREPITTNMINAGVYLIDAALLGRIPGDRPASIEREFFPGLIADGIPAFGWHVDAYWRDIGSPVVGPCVVGAGARLAAGSRVGPFAVLGDGVHVAGGASVEHAILWERVDVGPDTVLRGCVLGADVKIGSGATIAPGVVLESGAVVPAGARLPLAG
jgi:mannose-1-phosphate guanylyltransferase